MNAGTLQPRFQNEKQNCTDKSGVKKERGHQGSLNGWFYVCVCLCVCTFWLLSSAFYQTARQAYKLD